jgi:hypothetical protein
VRTVLGAGSNRGGQRTLREGGNGRGCQVAEVWLIRTGE